MAHFEFIMVLIYQTWDKNIRDIKQPGRQRWGRHQKKKKCLILSQNFANVGRVYSLLQRYTFNSA